MNITEAVRNYAAVNGTISKKEVRAALNLKIDQAVYAFETLKRQGYLMRVGHGLYQFSDYVEKPGIELKDKIWKAMKISPVFTAADIAKLADSTTSYVYKRFRQFRADGYIKQHGTKRQVGTSPKKLWRLTPKGKEKSHQPNIASFQPDPLVMAAVNLNRLICSGVAIRDHKAGEQALKFVEQIKNGLEDAATS
ncbi:MAG: hypothetical protein GY710_00940 [Desulfobacteraceae bacterium]|nr:hypothetical protein [Desulfobacteraceae bacterium]